MARRGGDVLVLSFEAALKAIAEHAEQGRLLESWEGWVKFRDGTKAKSLSYGGSFALPRDVGRAAATAKSGIERAQAHWARDPEYPGAELWFGLSFAESRPTAT